MTAPDLINLTAPDTLKNLRGWLVWNFEDNKGKKPRKVPYYANGGIRWGGQGMAKDRANLVTFDDAKAAALAKGCSGVGFALMPEFGITALDFDDCVTDGVIDPQVEALVAGTYAEFSPSGNGIRAFVVGSLGTGKSNPKDKSTFGFEVFDCNGFVTFTGNVTPTTELVGSENYFAPISDELRTFRDMRLKRARTPFEYEATGEATLGLTDAELNQILTALPNDLSYEEWFNVCCALHHETQGEGFTLFDEWSHASPKGGTTEYNWERWASCGRYNGALFTARSLLRYARDDLHIDTGIEIDVASVDDFPTYDAKPGGTFRIVNALDFANNRPSLTWLVKGFLPKAQLGVLFGESGAGKSFACLDICAAIARGVEDWNGHRVKRGRVMYVVAEGADGFGPRIRAYAHQHGLTELDIDVIGDMTPNLTKTNEITDLIKDLKAFGPYDLVVLDTFAQVTAGINENSGEDMGAALEQCKRINKDTGAMVLLVHHSGKDSSKGARGWSGLKAACDVEIEVACNGDMRSVSLTKLKDGSGGFGYRFSLLSVLLGLDEDGDDITSCIVEYKGKGTVEKAKKESLGPRQREAWAVFNDLIGVDIVAGVERQDFKEAIMALYPDKRKDNASAMAERAIDDLISKNYVLAENNTLFLADKLGQ